jgi:hypothetical protein
MIFAPLVRQVKLVGFYQLKGTGHGTCSFTVKSNRRLTGRPAEQPLAPPEVKSGVSLPRKTSALRMRVADRQVLRLIRLWLEAPIEETDPRGRRSVHRSRQGTPQGGVISPLLANIYLHWFEVRFQRPEGPGEWAHAKIVRYADDFVVLAPPSGESP